MASYSNPMRVTYSYGLYAFTSASTNTVKPSPRHPAGKVADIHVRVTVTFTQTTTPAFVNIGTAGNASKYAQLNMGAAAAGHSYNFTDAMGTPAVPSLVVFSDINFARDGITEVQIQIVAMTGGTPAGSGYLDVCMDWF
jgi:hypothetical protein